MDRKTLAPTVLLLLASLAFGQAGHLDSSFGGDGKVLTDLLGSGWESPVAAALVARRNDGRIVVAGSTLASDLQDRWFVARFRPDGTPDLDFGTGGWATSLHSEYSALWYGLGSGPIGIALDGTAVIVAGTDLSPVDFKATIRVWRLLDDGSPDPSFGTGGMATVGWPGYGSLEACGVTMEGSRILVGATLYSTSPWPDMAVVALTPEGNLDASYGSGGFAVVDFGASESARSLVSSADGAVTLVGASHSGGNYSIALVKLTASGTLDPTFGSGGMVIVPSSQQLAVHAAEATPDGDVALLTYPLSSTSQHRILLYGASGVLEASFPVQVESYPSTPDFAVLPDGALAILQTLPGSAAGTWRADVRRYLPAGVLDATFGASGVATVDLGESGSARWLDAASDGSLLLTGSVLGQGTAFDTALWRLLPQGDLDAGFGGGAGRATLDVHVSQDDQARDLVVMQGDGKLLVLGQTIGMSGTQDPYHPVLLRYLPDGSLDAAFGQDGVLSLPFYLTCSTCFFDPTALAIQSSGRIVIAARGSQPGGPNGAGQIDFLLVGLDTDGALDPTFGTGGIVVLERPYSNEEPTGIVVLPDDRLVVAGYRLPASAVVAWFHADGTLDTSRGTQGELELTWPGLSYYDDGLALASDGRIGVAGTWSYQIGTTWTNEVILAQVAPDGTSDGFVPTGIAGFLRANTFDAAGRSVLACEPGGSTSTHVARVLIDGTLDPTFGQGGVAAATVVGSVGRFAGVDVLAQGDHKVVVVGFATGLPALTQDFAVVRLDADGTLDQDFGTAGSAVVDFGRNEYPVAASIQGDGAIVVAGRSISYLQVSNGASPSDIALARLHGITTPDAVIEELVPVVQDYVDQGLLSHTASKSLQSKLEAALQQVENGNMQPAVKQLEAFIHQVGALVNSGHLSAGDGAHLADGAIDARTLILNG